MPQSKIIGKLTSYATAQLKACSHFQQSRGCNQMQFINSKLL